MQKRCVLIRTALSIVLAALALASANNVRGQEPSSPGQLSNFDVDFTNCVESIGVTLVPTSSVRALVPQSFTLASADQPVTPLVVRTARCRRIATDGYGQIGGDIVQIGAVIVPPDFTGDINNYTLWYYTTNLRLALRLQVAGVNAQYVPTIDYDYDAANGELHVRVPLPGVPRFVLSGAVTPSAQPAGSFVANWWQSGRGGTTKMSTTVPTINIGGAELTLTTSASGALGQLIGRPSTGFPIIQQFNTFANAQMQVTVTP
jgi:hypothetical protein